MLEAQTQDEYSHYSIPDAKSAVWLKNQHVTTFSLKQKTNECVDYIKRKLSATCAIRLPFPGEHLAVSAGLGRCLRGTNRGLGSVVKHCIQPAHHIKHKPYHKNSTTVAMSSCIAPCKML